MSPTDLTRAGLSLAYEVDLASPHTHSVGVMLKIRTKWITSLVLSTSRYPPVATACEPEAAEFSAEPATGFSRSGEQAPTPVPRPDQVASDQRSYIVYLKGALVAYLLDQGI